MTEVTEDRLLRKLEDVERAINDINLSIAEKLGETKACRAKCVDAYSAIYGNGNNMGLKAKMWVIWGGIGLAWTAILGIVANLTSG